MGNKVTLQDSQSRPCCSPTIAKLSIIHAVDNRKTFYLDSRHKKEKERSTVPKLSMAINHIMGFVVAPRVYQLLGKKKHGSLIVLKIANKIHFSRNKKSLSASLFLHES